MGIPLRLKPSSLVACCALLWAFFQVEKVALAQTGGSTPTPVTTSEETKVERPVKVLQNRYFLKAMRPEFNLFGGTVLNESYSSTFALGGRLGMFITEVFGFEYSYTHFKADDSADLKALRKIVYCDAQGRCKQIEPSFVRLVSNHGATATFAPVYGKINLLDWVILYSDIYVNAGIGFLAWSSPIENRSGSKNAGLIGIGQRFYFAKNFNVRFDATDHIFMEERENLGIKKTSLRNAWTVSAGISAFLWDNNK